MLREPFVPLESRRRRLAALGAIAIVLIAVVVRGRGGGPVPLSTAIKATTNGSFYHWRTFDRGVLHTEGWCALRRSRTLLYQNGKVLADLRESPAGVYFSTQGRTSFRPEKDVVGMEEGNDLLTKRTTMLAGTETRLTPSGRGRWTCGSATYTLEPRTLRILRIEAPGETILIDYPLAVSSDLFEAPR